MKRHGKRPNYPLFLSSLWSLPSFLLPFISWAVRQQNLTLEDRGWIGATQQASNPARRPARERGPNAATGHGAGARPQRGPVTACERDPGAGTAPSAATALACDPSMAPSRRASAAQRSVRARSWCSACGLWAWVMKRGDVQLLNTVQILKLLLKYR